MPTAASRGGHSSCSRRSPSRCSPSLLAGVSDTDNLVRATSACFIAVYVLAVYSATRILDGRLRALAWVTLGMVLVLAVFSTWYLAVPVVAAAISVGLHRYHR